MEFSKKLEIIIGTYPHNAGLLIAYSGGADSTALLHLLAKYNNVRAIHINHGLQANADVWQSHCQKTCNNLGIELITENANLKDASENTCRQARYAFFSKHLKPNEILLTAHHNQDQAETILLKLLRGTGINGLTGIDKIRKFAKGYIARPLLDFSPAILEQYLQEHYINWIEDSSNDDNSYKRNYLRNEIIPKLQNQFPNTIENITRSTINTQHSLKLLNHFIDFKHRYLKIEKLKALPKQLQSSLFYHWLAYKELPIPNKNTLQQITKDFISAKKDKQPHYQNKFYQLFRWQDAIYCIRNYTIINSEKTYKWNTKKPFKLPNNCGALTYKSKKSFDFIIKFNQRGEKLKTRKHFMTKTVKKLFQENNIPIWGKQNTPFIYHNDILVSLGFSWSSSLKHRNIRLLSQQNFII